MQKTEHENLLSKEAIHQKTTYMMGERQNIQDNKQILKISLSQ